VVPSCRGNSVKNEQETPVKYFIISANRNGLCASYRLAAGLCSPPPSTPQPLGSEAPLAPRRGFCFETRIGSVVAYIFHMSKRTSTPIDTAPPARPQHRAVDHAVMAPRWPPLAGPRPGVRGSFPDRRDLARLRSRQDRRRRAEPGDLPAGLPAIVHERHSAAAASADRARLAARFDVETRPPLLSAAGQRGGRRRTRARRVGSDGAEQRYALEIRHRRIFNDEVWTDLLRDGKARCDAWSTLPAAMMTWPNCA
jgi:hypothetical protein